MAYQVDRTLHSLPAVAGAMAINPGLAGILKRRAAERSIHLASAPPTLP